MSACAFMTLKGSDPKLDPYLGTIVGNWITTLHDTNDWFKLIDRDAYYATYKKVIHATLGRPGCSVNVAVLEDDPDVCVGWCVYEGKTLHYCFVPRDGRRQGIARAIAPKEIDTITHLTTPGIAIWRSKLPKAIFNPFQT